MKTRSGEGVAEPRGCWRKAGGGEDQNTLYTWKKFSMNQNIKINETKYILNKYCLFVQVFHFLHTS